MRKWLIALTIIFGASFIASASLAGKVYYQGGMEYTDHDNKSLDLASIKNIYIKSDIPVTIKPTTGEAYTEFNQSCETFFGDNEKYKLSTASKDEVCHIDLTQIKASTFNLGKRNDTKVLTVYLPVKALDTLEIDYTGYRDVYRTEEIDLTGFDIKNLRIEQYWTNVNLDGNYESINLITGGASTININSKKQANVELNGSANYELKGIFKTLEITNSDETKVTEMNQCKVEKMSIDGNVRRLTMNECKIEKLIAEISESDIKFTGECKKVNITGYNNAINLQTSTLCDVTIQDNDGNVTLDGPFNDINIDAESAVVDIKTIKPQSIKIKGEDNQTTLNLPTNIPGFKLMCMSEELNDGESIDQYTTYDVNEGERDEFKEASTKILSEFKLTEKEKNIYSYGDGSSRIMIRVGKSLNILESGQIAK
ncbi:hypothetical protein [Cellulosilyticum ruminicola]|uniref:hypothetical protein n=1 Tax=Cellulosilyticum ruminicola TaxID=425254 RepID=UPI0006D1A639|nr:hypothetical protein [Cellulosilyticum ruminicola]